VVWRSVFGASSFSGFDRSRKYPGGEREVVRCGGREHANVSFALLSGVLTD